MKTLIATLLLAACAAAQNGPEFAPVEDTPGLPRVLLIGDSISIGYTLPVRELLKGKANVHRIPGNGGPTTNGLKNLDEWLAGKWDVIHFNFGLHDLKIGDDGSRQVPLEQYGAEPAGHRGPAEQDRRPAGMGQHHAGAGRRGEPAAPERRRGGL